MLKSINSSQLRKAAQKGEGYRDDFAQHLSSKGVLLFVQPTLRNLERHARPSQRYLLAEGELRELAIASALKILHYAEDWSVEGRHEALLVAEREDVG